MVGEYKPKHNQYISIAWQLVYVFSTFFSLNKILRLQPVILFFFPLCILFSEQEIRKEPTFFQYIIHSLLFWRFICAPFSSMFSFYLHSSVLLCSALLYSVSFSLVVAFTIALYFQPCNFLSALCVYVFFFMYANFVHRTIFLIFILWFMHDLYGQTILWAKKSSRGRNKKMLK